jgi:hypothetical protein
VPWASVPHGEAVWAGDALNTLLRAALTPGVFATVPVVSAVGLSVSDAGGWDDEKMLKLPARTPVGSVVSPAIDGAPSGISVGNVLAAAVCGVEPGPLRACICPRAVDTVGST